MKELSDMIKELRDKKPLVMCMTNDVVTDFNANALLSIGALPVMTYAKEDVEEMATISNGLLLNIGTLTKDLVDFMILAGKTANKNNVPVVLDPVGVGATKFRLNETLRILDNVKVSVVKGNGGEIATLLNYNSKMKGVESGEILEDLSVLAKECAKKYDLVCSITGKDDYVSEGEKVHIVKDNGVEMLNKVVGTGCTVGALTSGFCSLGDNYLGSICALEIMKKCGQMAYEKSGENPGTFKVELINALYNIKKSPKK